MLPRKAKLQQSIGGKCLVLPQAQWGYSFFRYG